MRTYVHVGVLMRLCAYVFVDVWLCACVCAYVCLCQSNMEAHMVFAFFPPRAATRCVWAAFFSPFRIQQIGISDTGDPEMNNLGAAWIR